MKVLIALGGNAILKHADRGTAEEQFANIRRTSKELVKLIEAGYQLIITHGNGPQVGDILLKNEIARNTLPVMPLDVCGAETPGMIGYMLQQCLRNELQSHGIKLQTVTLLTQTLIDKEDPAMKQPTKPIGPFYSSSESLRLRQEMGWTIISDSGRGYRRVVPSPYPRSIIESEIIGKLFGEGFLIIQSGGGGIPVVKDEEGNIHGVEAVIDKDLSASLLASILGVDILMMLTDVEKVALNYSKPNEIKLDRLSVGDCRLYEAQGQFPPGSMGPKIEAAVRFVEAGGQAAIITSLELAKAALEGKAGTTVSNS